MDLDSHGIAVFLPISLLCKPVENSLANEPYTRNFKKKKCNQQEKEEKERTSCVIYLSGLELAFKSFYIDNAGEMCCSVVLWKRENGYSGEDELSFITIKVRKM